MPAFQNARNYALVLSLHSQRQAAFHSITITEVAQATRPDNFFYLTINIQKARIKLKYQGI